MQTIIIIENEIPDLDALLSIFREWQTELDILTARDAAEALHTLKHTPVDVVLCSTEIYDSQNNRLLPEIAAIYPFTPCIGFCDDNLAAEYAPPSTVGATYIHSKPYDAAILFEQIAELLSTTELESIKEIPTHSLLQMLETEERTCTVKIYGKSETGYIFVSEGEVISAECGQQVGEFAVFEIIGWDDVVIEILHFNGLRDKEITKPLIALIMEGFRLKDEQDTEETDFGLSKKPQPQLKKLSTIGQRISLDIGSRVKVDFHQLEGTYNCTTVGMLIDEYLVVSCPGHLISKQDRLPPGCHALVKYMHMGKLCLFKTNIISIVDKPQNTIFLEYPTAIHYHELRQTKRTNIFIPCTLHFHGKGEFFGALIDMSSAGGLCEIKSKRNADIPAINIGSEIELRCLLPGMKEEQRIHGYIKNIKQNKTESLFGIEFFNMHSYLIETINKYLFSIEKITDQ